MMPTSKVSSFKFFAYKIISKGFCVVHAFKLQVFTTIFRFWDRILIPNFSLARKILTHFDN